ncbi:hypothetical protein [Gottfriedia acidiceleris]|uniref:hypothetical protein n=1 Tax=Gottfriedia acidiceleris TaxID=371036 RepID=UPI000B4360B7|nr:hypothetical protein [Gottfriedia acidiceleris]
MGCNCNNERNNERNNNERNNNERNNNERNNDRNRRNRDFTFNAKITIDQEEFCRAVNRCDDERRRSDRWWNW